MGHSFFGHYCALPDHQDAPLTSAIVPYLSKASKCRRLLGNGWGEGGVHLLAYTHCDYLRSSLGFFIRSHSRLNPVVLTALMLCRDICWENTHLCPRRCWQGGQEIVHTADELPQVQPHILREQKQSSFSTCLVKSCSTWDCTLG